MPTEFRTVDRVLDPIECIGCTRTTGTGTTMTFLPKGYVCQFCIATASDNLLRSEMHAIGTFEKLYGKVKDGK